MEIVRFVLVLIASGTLTLMGYGVTTPQWWVIMVLFVLYGTVCAAVGKKK